MQELLLNSIIAGGAITAAHQAPVELTATETYMSWFSAHPILVIFATLVVATMTAKALPALAGAVVGQITNTSWQVAKATGKALAKPFMRDGAIRESSPDWIRYQPKPGHRFGKAMGTTDEKLLTVLKVSEGQVHYNKAHEEEMRMRYIGNFSNYLKKEGWVRIS